MITETIKYKRNSDSDHLDKMFSYASARVIKLLICSLIHWNKKEKLKTTMIFVFNFSFWICFCNYGSIENTKIHYLYIHIYTYIPPLIFEEKNFLSYSYTNGFLTAAALTDCSLIRRRRLTMECVNPILVDCCVRTDARDTDNWNGDDRIVIISII